MSALRIPQQYHNGVARLYGEFSLIIPDEAYNEPKVDIVNDSSNLRALENNEMQ